MEKKVLELEERVKRLEDIISRISFTETKEITMTSCPIGNIYMGTDCKTNFQDCTIDSVVETDLDEIEDTLDNLDDLEDRLNELDDILDDVNDTLEELANKIDEIIG